MRSGQPSFSDCRWGPGVIITPTDTTRGITYSEAEFLGRRYWATGPDGKERIIKLVKNVSGATLLPCQALKYSTTAGRWGKDVTICADDTDPCCGVVESEYAGGVPTGKWFRMVQYGEHEVIMQTTSDARVTCAVGDPIVASADNGAVHKQNGTAANAAVQNRIGWMLQVTTNGTNNGLKASALIDVYQP